MRPIEFRGKRVDNGEWVEGDLWQPIRSTQCCFILRTDNKSEVIPETVGQCVGHPHTKMFADDIVREDITPMHAEEKIFREGVITWKDFKWVLHEINGTGYTELRAFDQYEVIGNTSDNPELLETQND